MVFCHSYLGLCSCQLCVKRGRFLVVAMPVKELEIYHPVGATKAARDEMIDLQHITRLKEQPTIGTLSLLIFQEVSYLGIRQGVVFQPLREVG